MLYHPVFIKESASNSLLMLHDSLPKPNGATYTLKDQMSIWLSTSWSWTFSVDEVFYIEQRLCAAKVWHIEQSWTEATEHSKLMRRDKMDLQHHPLSLVVLSKQHLEIYKDKLVDARAQTDGWIQK